MTRRKFDHAQAAALYTAGSTLGELADRFGVILPAMTRAVKGQGVTLRPDPHGTCSVDGCFRSVDVPSTGWCYTHYKRSQTHGDPGSGRIGPAPIADRFWAKVDKTATCWLWTGAKTGTGYGHFFYDGSARNAHRFAYINTVGPIPEGLQLDHLCRVRHCVNPAHMEPVTPRENTLRSEGPTARHARQTHCVRGHELTGENLAKGYSYRRCQTCLDEHKIARRKVA